MYDRSNVGMVMRRHVYVNLALWHTYKHACMKIWAAYSRYLMAGLFHCFFPSGIFLSKPSFTMVATQLTIIRLAYPHFKSKLDSAIASGRCSPVSLVALKNIKTLCSTLIPMVTINICIVKIGCHCLVLILLSLCLFLTCRACHVGSRLWRSIET